MAHALPPRHRGRPLLGLASSLYASGLASAAAALLPVGRLPGSEAGAPQAAHLSGYLEVASGQRRLRVFCYFVPHPEPEAPLVIWMNGGPGASSVWGLFTELGPFLLNSRSLPRAGRAEWQVFSNPFGWHTAASLLAWEQPAGVGFSRCASGSNCSAWDDTSSAEANLAVLRAFFDEHPSERNRELFIAGESYGGIYVPLLAQQVLSHNRRTADAGGRGAVRLKGIAVGNGCVGYAVPGSCGTDSLGTILAYLERGAPGLDLENLHAVRAACGDQLEAGAQRVADLAAPCRLALGGLWQELGAYNAYHYGSPCASSEQGNWGDGEAFACGAGAAFKEYVALAAVQRALHVIPDTAAAAPVPWETWDGSMPGYSITAGDVRGVYRELLEAGCRVLVYNGLRDTTVPVTGAERWTSLIGGQVSQGRRTWAAFGKLAGEVVVYASGLTFATVQGAGHLVPGDRPQAALAMLNAFVQAKPLPNMPSGQCSDVWLGRGYVNFCRGETIVHA